MLTQEQINELLKNKNVCKCSSKSITYSKEFKLGAVKKYFEEGLSPNEIFRDEGFNLNIIGRDKPKECLRRWRKNYNARGKSGLLKDNRGSSGGRRKKLEFKNKEEEIEYLKTKIRYLDAENDFLAKLRGLKRE